MNDNLEVEVFRAGDYGEKGRWDEACLDRIAADYDPALHEAPVTLDHARSGPALGWVAALRRVGDRLVARLRGVSLKLLELLRQGAFKKRSVELYPALRETGRPYLRALSFLGAAVPEVKGLADPLPMESGAALFSGDSANAPALRFEEALAADAPPAPEEAAATETEAADMAEAASSEPTPATPTPAPAAQPLCFSEVARRLRDVGAWRPAWAERGIARFYDALATLGEIELDAPEGGEKRRLHPADWFAAFLESLPPAVSFAEDAPAADSGLAGLMNGAAAVDPASLTLHRAALALQQAHPTLSYAEALLRCAGRK